MHFFFTPVRWHIHRWSQMDRAEGIYESLYRLTCLCYNGYVDMDILKSLGCRRDKDCVSACFCVCVYSRPSCLVSHTVSVLISPVGLQHQALLATLSPRQPAPDEPAVCMCMCLCMCACACGCLCVASWASVSVVLVDSCQLCVGCLTVICQSL